ncbi:MAG: hypothetical protein HKM93_19870 [Desulfobacteraceae bacterium]|nr:hypothetical protein [Desulfobacteraceae bacterium]
METNDIREQIKKMVELQAVENEAQQLRSVLDSVEVRLEALDQELKASQLTFDKDSEQTESLKKAYRDLESDTQANLSNIAKCNEKLRAVKTNKEYQSMLKEIDEFTKKNSTTEDLMLEYLEKLDTADLELKEKKQDLAAFEREIEEKKRDISEDASVKESRYTELTDSMETINSEIHADLRKQLDYVKEIVGITALSPVIDAVCQGCHMNIPPQLFNELQRFDKLFFCPNCHRIIYWKED